MWHWEDSKAWTVRSNTPPENVDGRVKPGHGNTLTMQPSADGGPVTLLAKMLSARPHAGFVDELLGGGIDRPAATPAWRVNIERSRVDPPLGRRGRQRDLVRHRHTVIGKQQFGTIDFIYLEQAA